MRTEEQQKKLEQFLMIELRAESIPESNQNPIVQDLKFLVGYCRELVRENEALGIFFQILEERKGKRWT